eukprot:CAMPEP_0115019008 /NCGR_PEP_ID=MMETSP0216-20121206/29172_1 /TAXON_ID=223996 /ORGANISM="Protocruzia adherens, Strain Boccale" /LENGTH=413 /DNA_ID=CAMNT_0002390365 /DNA_START=897 /DNA_END=2139 /DNA_ORIENTATION=-
MSLFSSDGGFASSLFDSIPVPAKKATPPSSTTVGRSSKKREAYDPLRSNKSISNGNKQENRSFANEDSYDPLQTKIKKGGNSPVNKIRVKSSNSSSNGGTSSKLPKSAIKRKSAASMEDDKKDLNRDFDAIMSGKANFDRKNAFVKKKEPVVKKAAASDLMKFQNSTTLKRRQFDKNSRLRGATRDRERGGDRMRDKQALSKSSRSATSKTKTMNTKAKVPEVREPQIWCARCNKMHSQSLHAKKASGAKSSEVPDRKVEPTARGAVVKRPMMTSGRAQGDVKRAKMSNGGAKHMGKHSRGPRNDDMRFPSYAGYHEDEAEDDDWIVDEDHQYDAHDRNLMNSVLGGYRHRFAEYADDGHESSDMEAGFDDIHREEQRTARLGALEDELEYQREQELDKKKEEDDHTNPLIQN